MGINIGSNSYESIGLHNGRPSVDELAAICFFCRNTKSEQEALERGYLINKSRYDEVTETYIESSYRVTKLGLEVYLKEKGKKWMMEITR